MVAARSGLVNWPRCGEYRTVDPSQLRAAIELLEQLGADPSRLAEVDGDLRSRLIAASGRIARPDRDTRAALSKAVVRARKQAQRGAEVAVLDQTGIRALRREPVFQTPPALPPAEPSRGRVANDQHCYGCKADFRELHHFYDQMCPSCAELNWHKRMATADLRGRTVLITGARVKIGYQAAIKLLRAGAEVIVATRFPRDAARRFASERDATDWVDRLRVYGIDLRHTPSVEQLCRHLQATLSRLDALINNACQTVRRPAGWYDHVVAGEAEPVSPIERRILEGDRALAAEPAVVRAVGAGPGHSAKLAQVPLLAEDLERGGALYPPGRLDQDLQQVDQREFNSWRMTLAEVPTAELLEVQLVNAIAPFVLNARLRPLLAAVPTRDAHVVNVSAMEGQFYRRWKTDKHPHTNMAKAALNMMTRTSASDYVRDGIHMNSVDTGWVTDEDPVVYAARKTAVHDFHPPLDIVDGAARIVDPVFEGIATGDHAWGLFLKDYKPAPW
jgi:NAD(P)-dependent dehydrogenase (short-subunit alcohol dehydrogenase family)